MAALYKRYIPPPSSTPASVQPEPRTIPTLNKQVQEKDAPKIGEKRKRERSAEEVAQRKAKKLQKKGVEVPFEVAHIAAGEAQPAAEYEVDTKAEIDTVARDDKDGASSDFSHVKNIKKRHKLEKEARKARKASDKLAKEGGVVESKAPLSTTADGGSKSDVSEQKHLDLAKVQNEDFEAEVTRKKSKKRRKEEKELEATVDNSNAKEAEISQENLATTKERHPDEEAGNIANLDAQRDQDISMVDVPAANLNQSKSQPKKRRHKLEAILQNTHSDVEMRENDEEHLQKHTGVIGKFQKATKTRDVDDDEETEEHSREEAPILHDLVPLPQPDRAPTPDFHPDYSDLPPWLAEPHVVTSHDKKSFADLHLDTRLVDQLSQLGLRDALPVQQAVLPLLLSPGTPGSRFRQGAESVVPDLAVSAATGSGKTLSYLLPIVEAERQQLSLGRLKALIVVPTRELVSQVAATAESLTKGTELRIGVSTGAGKFRDEQEKLIHRTSAHNPEEYARLLAKAHCRNYPPKEDSDEYAEYLEELEEQDAREEEYIQDTVGGLLDHVPVYNSAVNILICTPGRLLEHINNTLGFSLTHLKWLVLDEADKLLDEQYNGFLETLNTELTRERKPVEQDAREQYLRANGLWDEQLESRVRKVMLSATMTRDISKLMTLKLRWPRLLIVRGGEPEMIDSSKSDLPADEIRDAGDGFELPPTLTEYCIPVGDGSEKPLYLMELLKSQILPIEPSAMNIPEEKADPDSSSDSESSSDPDDTDSSDEDSDDELDSDTDSESSGTSDSSSTLSVEGSAMDITAVPHLPESATMHPARAALLTTPRPRHPAPNILIFTSSAESALRLSHLLTHLQPSWTPWLTTLTKSTFSTRRAPISTPAQHPSITISTDRSARGLDALSHRPITHVLQYDVPRSTPAYVHRVGRTARAGRSGEAWTLYTHREAAWFLKDVAKTAAVRRKAPVEKVRLDIGGSAGAAGETAEALRERYAAVLAGMREMVNGPQAQR